MNEHDRSEMIDRDGAEARDLEAIDLQRPGVIEMQK